MTIQIFHQYLLRKPFSVKPLMTRLSFFGVVTLSALLFLSVANTAIAQTLNFTPLERGDYSEEEEKIHILRGMKVSGAYAGQLRQNRHPDIEFGPRHTEYEQDFRLHLSTLFHRDISLELELTTDPAQVSPSGIRQRSQSTSGDATESQSLGVSARQAFLRYRFNPGSAILLGQHEISIGDRRGKLFNGLGPGATFDCKVGTWCMPFGAMRLGDHASDWLFHWALQYTAWDDKKPVFRDKLEVELFRIFYAENDIPFGKNRGPGYYDPANPDAVDPSQYKDAQGNPIYYDARDQEFIGIRMDWTGGAMFFNFDYTTNQGNRALRRKRTESGEKLPLDLGTEQDYLFKHKVAGWAWESEAGWRWATGHLGLRYMDASGDPLLAEGDLASLKNTSHGFYEITPGSYTGARLYFNGASGQLGSGDGLGHSINNTQLYGFFLNYDDNTKEKMTYRLGIYQLSLNNPIRNEDGSLATDIGLEVDNMLAFYIHKAMQLQFEINGIRPGKAFRLDDYSTPKQKNRTYSQGIVRLVYQF